MGVLRLAVVPETRKKQPAVSWRRARSDFKILRLCGNNVDSVASHQWL